MNYIIILIISAIAQYFLPWWVIAPISFLIGAWKSASALKAYAAAAGAIATLWLGYATFLNMSNDGIMVQKIGGLFSENLKFLKNMPITPTFLAIMTIIGSQVAGLSATAGYHFKALFK
ncbi:hypothetical protein EMA8858_03534 [Emticicia aquatica]|uniref:Uncharacterized protein n=1 Tax=Emticicia aquatica TaxID=1681835 RepID=A0ABM9ATQ4_9BACT|nr:hypothetical protein [Emticicia aquatica]CAH0997402.1 hypothetical protein EMA8858_03534 [Emticicia aquatica]